MSHKQPIKVSKNGSVNDHSPAVKPDPEVVSKAKRHTFNAEYELQTLAEADACTNRGEVGALLRREGINLSHLHKLRMQRQRGVAREHRAESRTDRMFRTDRKDAGEDVRVRPFGERRLRANMGWVREGRAAEKSIGDDRDVITQGEAGRGSVEESFCLYVLQASLGRSL